MDPDKLTDSKNGFSHIIKNIVIMFVMILLVPIVFRYAMELQRVVLQDDTIGRLITGRYGATNTNVGQQMATTILAGFVRPNTDVVGDACDTVTSADSPQFSSCIDKLNNSSNKGAGSTYEKALTEKDGYKKLIDLASSNEKSHGEYVISYSLLISTAVGGFTAYILLLFCIDIAVRTAKLAFLQLIAPIPIVTYIDDGGQGMFKKWTKECTNTYLSLFIRLAGIYFAIYLIQNFILSPNLQVCSFDGSNNCHTPSFLAVVFLILGSLMFAKELPKLIESITGLKLDGGFTLNPFKKLEQVPLVGKTASKGLGLAGRTAGNLAGFAWGATGAHVANAVGTAFKNKYNGSKMQGIVNSVGDKTGGIFHAVDSWGGNRLSRIGADFGGTVGTLTNRRDDAILASHKKVNDAISATENRALDKIKNGEAGALSMEYNQRRAMIDALKSQDTSGMTSEQLKAHTQDIAKAQYDFDNWYNNDAKYAYIDLNSGADDATYQIKDDNNNVIATYTKEGVFGKDSKSNKVNSDAALNGMMETYKKAAESGGHTVEDTASARHKQQGKFKGEDTEINNRRLAQREASSNNKK